MLIDRTGRRAWFVAAFTGSALALLSLWYVGADSVRHVLILGVGTATAWLRLASIIGPNIVGVLVARSDLASVFLVFGIVALTAALIVQLFAEETKSRILEEISP